MALIFMDGFSGGDISLKWDSVIGSWTRNTASPRITGGAYVTNTDGGLLRKFFPASAEMFFGIGVFAASSYQVRLKGDTNTTTHLTFNYDATTRVYTLFRGATLIGTGTRSIPPSTWHYFEFHALIADSGGTAELRIDGSATADISYTGDTKNAGTLTSIDTFEIAQSFGGPTMHLTDFVVCNTSGTANNTWPGDVTVRTLVPTGDGASSQLTGSDGNQVANWQLVDELPVNSADYVGAATTGFNDTYAMANLPTSVTQVKALQTNIYAAKSDASAASAKAVVRTASTNYYGSTQALGTSYQTYRDIFETNPNTALAWTTSEVNGVESGMEVA